MRDQKAEEELAKQAMRSLHLVEIKVFSKQGLVITMGILIATSRVSKIIMVMTFSRALIITMIYNMLTS
jgi:hypothetical protein